MDVFLAVASSPDTPPEVKSGLYRRYSGELSRLGVALSEQSDVAVVVVVTGGSENEILASFRSYNILLAWPQYNSLPAALEAAAALRDSGRWVRVIRSSYGEPLGEALVKSLRLVQLMKAGTPKFGLVGSPNAWLVSSNFYPATVDQASLEDSLQLADAAKGADDARELVARAKSSEFSRRQIMSMTAYARALESLAKARGWDGLTLGCWCFDRRAIAAIGWTPCISLALLNQRGVPAACEGDLRALYSMYVLAKLSGGPSWMGNINMAEGDLLLLTHDGAPPAMAEEYSLVKRMGTGAPAAIRAQVGSGRPATLMRVSADLKRALLLKAVTVEVERIEACNTQIGFKLLNGTADDVLEASLGNHLAFVLDDVYDEAKEYLVHVGARVIP